MPHRTLDDWLTLQQSVHLRSIDMSLGRVADVARRLGLDRPAYPCVTVAGTNGKGSTVAHLAALWRAAGHHVGSYSSPHLVRYNERVLVDGSEVTDAALVRAFETIEAARGEITLTFFEYGTLAALEIFRTQRVDVAVLEVGLGGRLDAVNLVDADVAIICSIGIDHRDWLGDTLDAIGREKAGIFRSGRPAVLATPDMPASVYQRAQELGTPLLIAGRDFEAVPAIEGRWDYRGLDTHCTGLPPPALPGHKQYGNAAAALAAAELLARTWPAIQVPTCAQVAEALAAVALPGRFQIVPRSRDAGGIEWILDVAHNEDAAKVLAENLAVRPAQAGARTFAVLGMLGDKDADTVARVLAPCIDHWILCTIAEDRGLTAEQLRGRSQVFGAEVPLAASVAAGMELARAAARPGDRVIVFGSFHTVGPALKWLRL